MSELERLIDILDEDLERLRKSPNDAIHHYYTRILLTLAQEIQALKEATNE